MAGLHVPLPTLRRRPHGRLRTAWGRCGSLLLHRSGLSPPTPYRSPGAPVWKPGTKAAVLPIWPEAAIRGSPRKICKGCWLCENHLRVVRAQDWFG